MIVSFLISQQNNIFRIEKCIDQISKKIRRGKNREDGTVIMLFRQRRP